MPDNEERRRDEYGSARVAAALALIAAVVFMLIDDALNDHYEVSALVVTSVLGAAAALLGVEIVDFVRRSAGRK